MLVGIRYTATWTTGGRSTTVPLGETAMQTLWDICDHEGLGWISVEWEYVPWQ
jgi:hypothetical protein